MTTLEYVSVILVDHIFSGDYQIEDKLRNFELQLTHIAYCRNIAEYGTVLYGTDLI